MVREYFPNSNLIFRAITLLEPVKKQLIPFLQCERQGLTLPTPPPRTAAVLYYIDKPTQFRQVKVDLDNQRLYDFKDLDGKHAFVDAGEMKKCEHACLSDSRVQAAIKALDLPKEAVVVVDPWTYSPDGENDMKRRVVMVRKPQHGGLLTKDKSVSCI